eukprot:CAMPEP_0172511262 /NCGR_PEP_ID=MMETSP1066-20121228/235105_1 /TAXON_ID=671091 /ORGANISM="Coscinodiscus wailesii, Strain CCMP2513" /LENGTH=224 /DNA_ID=CAMNT_0013290571 /DNA_START=8 /DNA_END=685 /DNA_ORIENTATION=-
MGSSTSHLRRLDNQESMKMSIPLPFDTIDKGHQSGIEGALLRTYRTKESFLSLWEHHTSKTYPPPSFPEIDFESSMVLSAFRGMVNTGGYGIEIADVEDLASEIVVNCLTTDPPEWSMTAQAISEPFHIVNITASDKPVRYVITPIAPAGKPFPTFMLMFDDDTDVEDIMRNIEQNESVDSVTLLATVGIGMVYFDSKKITAEDAMKYLMDFPGVQLVEADPPL